MVSSTPISSNTPPPAEGAQPSFQSPGNKAEKPNSSAAHELNRPLPSSPDAEKGVLSALLQSPENLIMDAVETLKSEAFYVPAHKLLYETIIRLPDEGQPVDPVTLQEALIRKKLMEKVGGPVAVSELLTFVPDASHFEFYRDIVLEKALLRKIILTCTAGIKEAYEGEDEPRSVLDKVESKILDVGDDEIDTKRQEPLETTVLRALGRIDEIFEGNGQVMGVPFGFRDIDKMTNGMHSGQMIIIAGRPGMGKTSLAMNIVEHVAIDQKMPVAVFSLEMSNDELVQRMIFSRAKVDVAKIRDGRPDVDAHPRIVDAANELVGSKIFIDDTPGIGILEIKSKARRLKREGIKLIIVDYLQLVKCERELLTKNSNREQEVAMISREVKGLAKELELPIIILAQLNRQPEQRGGGQPRLSDLRESGSIEQDADLVGLIARPEVYEDDEAKREEMEGEAVFHIAKQRSGPIGDVKLTFIHNQTRFADAAFGFQVGEG
ncbi:MAG: replicative DNA helicase [Verrucomicrobiota bacterium]